MARDPRKDPPVASHDIDQYPSLSEGLRRVQEATKNQRVSVSRIDIRFDAGGHGYYRLWEGRDGDYSVGAAPRP